MLLDTNLSGYEYERQSNDNSLDGSLDGRRNRARCQDRNGKSQVCSDQVAIFGNADCGDLGLLPARLAEHGPTFRIVWIDDPYIEGVEGSGVSVRTWFYLKIINAIMAITLVRLYAQNGDIRDGQSAAMLIVLVLFMQFASPIFDEDETS